jgi:hypothetical protein
VGMQQAWVFECDVRCQKKLSIYNPDARMARLLALDRGWETVLRAEANGTSVIWLCPRHKGLSALPEAEHEDWCPRKTRNSACACSVRLFSPAMADQAVADVPWRRGITVIRPFGEIL